MQRRWLAPLAPLSGAVGIVLLVVGFFVLGGSTPNTTDRVGKVVTFYRDHYHRELWAAVLVLVAALFIVWFGVALRQAFVTRDPTSERLANVALVACAFLGVGMTVLAGVHLALTDSAHHLYLGAIPALNALDNDLFTVLVVPDFLLILVVAAASLRYALFPRWLGWISVVIAVSVLTPAAFVGLVASLVLLIVVSVWVYMWERDAGVAAPAPRPPEVGAPAAV